MTDENVPAFSVEEEDDDAVAIVVVVALVMEDILKRRCYFLFTFKNELFGLCC